MAAVTGTYKLEGQLLEVCSCGTLCPCWVGDDPDMGTCDSFVVYHVERGHIGGVDVSGLTLVNLVYIPGNVLAGNWKVVRYVDGRGTAAQQQAMLAAFGGELGGPLADLSKLVGELVDVRVAPIDYHLHEGGGTVSIDGVLHGEMQPFRGPDGQPTKLVDSIFSTIPGSPAYVAKASKSWANVPEHGMVWEYSGRNAIQGVFRLEA